MRTEETGAKKLGHIHLIRWWNFLMFRFFGTFAAIKNMLMYHKKMYQNCSITKTIKIDSLYHQNLGNYFNNLVRTWEDGIYD